MTIGVRSGTDWIRFIRLLDLRLYHVLTSHIMELEQMMECLLQKMDANIKVMKEIVNEIKDKIK